MHKFRLITLAVALLLSSSFTMAEGLADRRNEALHPDRAMMYVGAAHKMHGPTAAGKISGKKHTTMHGKMNKHMGAFPKYQGARSNHQYHGLTAHEFKRSTVGSD